MRSGQVTLNLFTGTFEYCGQGNVERRCAMVTRALVIVVENDVGTVV